eukprot:SAG31_NODE_4131_length_3555_cov_6.788773_1_plen_244_part_00
MYHVVLLVVLLQLGLHSADGGAAASLHSSGRRGSPSSFPNYPETFMVHTTESETATGKVTLQQTIVQDHERRRSMMLAHGSLVAGTMQQIRRCDIWPVGWLAIIAGPSDAKLQCRNATQDPSPAECEWTPFWSVAANASGPTQDVILRDGTNISCSRWEWWEQQEKHAFWGTVDVPLRLAKTFTAHPGWSLWQIDFTKFVGWFAPIAAFDPLPGNHCPSATPPSSVDIHGKMMSLASLGSHLV